MRVFTYIITTRCVCVTGKACIPCSRNAISIHVHKCSKKQPVLRGVGYVTCMFYVRCLNRISTY